MLTVNIGPVALALDHVLLLGALGLATLVGWRVARRGGDNPETTLFVLFMFGLLAARLGFVIAYWSQYRDDLMQIIDIRDGGFLTWAGLLAVLTGAAWQYRRQPLMRRPLAAGLATGLLFWLLGTLASHLYERGTQLPDITLHNAAGQSVQLADFQGRPLVINLWATWCPPCRREMPVLQQAQNERNDVVFLFVNQGESPGTVITFLATSGLGLSHVLFDGSGRLAQQVGSSALPTTLCYDAQGRLIGSHLGELSRASLARALESFGRPPAATSPVSARSAP
ncbi:Thiol-disulfide oxidoreductase ResA [compost metagenome]